MRVLHNVVIQHKSNIKNRIMCTYKKYDLHQIWSQSEYYKSCEMYTTDPAPEPSVWVAYAGDELGDAPSPAR